MNITILKSKIHNATVTQSDFEYEGSISIDEGLMYLANIYEYEKVLVVNFNNGNRYETYVIKAPEGSGTIAVNGAGARYSLVGDKILIMSFRNIDVDEYESFKPTILKLNNKNNVIKSRQ